MGRGVISNGISTQAITKCPIKAEFTKVNVETLLTDSSLLSMHNLKKKENQVFSMSLYLSALCTVGQNLKLVVQAPYCIDIMVKKKINDYNTKQYRS